MEDTVSFLAFNLLLSNQYNGRYSQFSSLQGIYFYLINTMEDTVSFLAFSIASEAEWREKL